MSTIFATDEAVRIAITNHAVEQIEIANYKAVSHLGHTAIATRWRDILAQEAAVSAKIDEPMPARVDVAPATGSNQPSAGRRFVATIVPRLV